MGSKAWGWKGEAPRTTHALYFQKESEVRREVRLGKEVRRKEYEERVVIELECEVHTPT